MDISNCSLRPGLAQKNRSSPTNQPHTDSGVTRQGKSFISYTPSITNF